MTFTKALFELAIERGVRVNAAAPGLDASYVTGSVLDLTGGRMLPAEWSTAGFRLLTADC